MRKIQPVNSNVLLEFIENDQKTKSGIIIPDTAQEKPKEAKVSAVAADTSGQVAIGDLVIFKEYGGTNINFDDKEYLLIPEGDILAKIVEVDEI